MRSGTSFFNGTLYRKNLTRFWPIWAAYALIWALILPIPFLTVQLSGGVEQDAVTRELMRHANQVCCTLESGVMLAAVFGVLCAMSVFSYLFSSRSACMMHALPMDRRALFITNYLSGLSFLLLPNAAVCLAALALEMLYGCTQVSLLFSWLLVQSGTALFFYSFAVFCAMFTGNLLAMPAFYGILNFLVMFVVSLLSESMSNFLYGFRGMGSRVEGAVMWLTPAARMMDACDTWRQSVSADGTTTGWNSYHIEEPGVIAVYAIAAVVLTLAALWIYRRRHVESAGDVVAIPIVRPLFKYGVALCSGLALGIATAYMLGFYDESLPLSVCMLLWTGIGYFVAEMLLRKSFRVLKAWPGCVAVTACLFLLLTAVHNDWFGYERRVPSPEQVTQIRVMDLYTGAPYDSANYGGTVVVTDEKQVLEILALHQAIVDQRDRQNRVGDSYGNLYVEYTLTGGETLTRRYYSIPLFEGETEAVGSATRAAYRLINDRDFIRAAYGLDRNLEQWELHQVYLNRLWSEEMQDMRYDEYQLGETVQQRMALWQAVQADFEEGTIGVRYLFEDTVQRMENTCATELVFHWRQPLNQAKPVEEGEHIAMVTYDSYGWEMSITLTPDARNTLACLEELGVDTSLLITNAELNRRLEK